MANTPNLDLVKPSPLDPITQDTWAGDPNDNFDKIDGALVAATTSANGLMSAADKTKLDGIAAGAQVLGLTGAMMNTGRGWQARARISFRRTAYRLLPYDRSTTSGREVVCCMIVPLDVLSSWRIDRFIVPSSSS